MHGYSDISWGFFDEKIGPIGGVGVFDALEVSCPGLSVKKDGVVAFESSGLAGGLCVPLGEGGNMGGPPGFRP